MKTKLLCVVLIFIPMLLMLGCDTVKTTASANDNAAPTQCPYDGSLISGLLDRVVASSNKVESFPVKITSAELVRQGCLIHYDKLAYYENYKRGSTDPDESFFTNDEEVDEQTVVTGAYLNSSKVKSPYLDKVFVQYISGKKSGAPFTLYWLDGQVIFVSEILIQ